MYRLKQKIITIVIVLNISCFTIASEQSNGKGFIDDSTLNGHVRSLYYSRDFTSSHNTNKSKYKAWALGLSSIFESGFTEGTVGFGFDAWALQGIRLDGGKGHAYNGIDVMPVGDNGNGRYAHDWSQLGGAIKARISNTTIKYGNQFVHLPVLDTDTTELLPESVTGVLITSREINNLEINAGHFTALSNPRATGTDDTGYPDAYFVGLKQLDLIGATYNFTDNLSSALYFSWNKDIAKRAYANINYAYPFLNNKSIGFDFNIYRTNYNSEYVRRNTDNELNKSEKNTIWSLAPNFTIGAHKFTVAYQQSQGGFDGHGFDYGGYGTNDAGATIYLANSYEVDYNYEGEKSVQLSYELTGDGVGIPGLGFKTAYLYAWNAKTNGDNKRGKEREFYNQIAYTIQTGPAKDLAFKLRASIYRADNHFMYNSDNLDIRFFIDYPIDLMAVIKK